LAEAFQYFQVVMPAKAGHPVLRAARFVHTTGRSGMLDRPVLPVLPGDDELENIANAATTR
jgi:hypothetical protein